jgi:hypothetical protein
LSRRKYTRCLFGSAPDFSVRAPGSEINRVGGLMSQSVAFLPALRPGVRVRNYRSKNLLCDLQNPNNTKVIKISTLV